MKNKWEYRQEEKDARLRDNERSVISSSQRREMVTPVTGKRRRIKERRRKDEIRRRWERAELTWERQIGKGSEERKGKSLREREEKVLPRNHAPRSPTDFYVQTKDGEGERRGNPWDASQSAALVCTVKRISPSLSLFPLAKVEMHSRT